MCRAGGPRCDGKGRRSKANTTNTEASGGTATAVADPPSSSVPTREDADRLAAAYDPNATGWDGQPLDDKGRRLYALRASGWKGPIDQDGYPATEGRAADILRHMARERGENPDW